MCGGDKGHWPRTPFLPHSGARQHLPLQDPVSCTDCGPGIPAGGFSGEATVVVTCNPLAPKLRTVPYDQATRTVILTWGDPHAGTPA